mgnify:CR=1 FL=1
MSISLPIIAGLLGLGYMIINISWFMKNVAEDGEVRDDSDSLTDVA